MVQRIQSGRDIAPDTRIEQRDLCFIAQLGDVFAKLRRDRRHHLG
jgi:hypothetical protein